MKKTGLLFLLLLLFPFCALLSQDNKDKSELGRIYQSTEAIRDSLNVSYKTFSDQLNETTDTSKRNALLKSLGEIEKAISRSKEDELKKELEFVRTHLYSTISLDILAYKIYKQEALEYYSTFTTLFNELSPALKGSQKGKQLSETLTRIKNSEAGSLAPEFLVSDIRKETLSLSSFKNKKYVLLDFWASWCIPCRKDFPFLKQTYEKYSSRGFEIISISTDSDREKWIAAIEKDNIGEWKHVSTIENSGSVASSYFVAALPMKILISKEGRILARWRGGGEENKESLEKTLREIFEIP